MVTGIVLKTASKNNDNANLVAWRFADSAIWKKDSCDTFIMSYHRDLDAEVVGRLPISHGDNSEEDSKDEMPLSAFITNTTLPRDIFEIRSKNAKTVAIDDFEFDSAHRVVGRKKGLATIFETPNPDLIDTGTQTDDIPRSSNDPPSDESPSANEGIRSHTSFHDPHLNSTKPIPT